MPAFLSKTCGCGRSISVRCDTLDNLLEAQAQMVGWGFDERGRVRGPQCMAAPPEQRPKPAPDLFSAGAA